MYRMSIESCRTYEPVTCHIYESCHIWMSHVTYGWVRSQLWRGSFTCCICIESCRTYELIVRHIWMSHVTHIRMRRLIHSFDMTHSYVTQDWSICATWFNSYAAQLWMRRSHVNETSHIWIHTNESWHSSHMNETSHIWIHTNESWHRCHMNETSHTWIHTANCK